MTQNKKIVKLSVIRDNEESPCPFGLEIPCGCKTVGETITKMAPFDILGEESSEEEKKEIVKANNYVFRWRRTGEKCPFANELVKDKVICFWKSYGAGVHGSALMGSPLYYKHFNGFDGVFSFPLGSYYIASSIPANNYMGYFSLESSAFSEMDFKPTNKK